MKDARRTAYCDACSIVQMADADDCRTLECVRIKDFAVRIGYGNVALVSAINLVHHLPEQSAMCAGVVQILSVNEIMDHLMDDYVIEVFLWKVEASAEVQAEVVFLPGAVRTSTVVETHLSDIAFGGRELEYRHRQPATEAEVVEVFEALA